MTRFDASQDAATFWHSMLPQRAMTLSVSGIGIAVSVAGLMLLATRGIALNYAALAVFGGGFGALGVFGNQSLWRGRIVALEIDESSLTLTTSGRSSRVLHWSDPAFALRLEDTSRWAKPPVPGASPYMLFDLRHSSSWGPIPKEAFDAIITTANANGLSIDESRIEGLGNSGSPTIRYGISGN